VDEPLDIVTATGAHVRSAGRREVHDGGHWHQVFHCLVVRSAPPARVVLQRRHRAKVAFPGLLDLSATGHLTAGERPVDGVRELNEELGIQVTPADLVPIGVRLLADDDGGEGHNRERVHLFFVTDDRPLDHYDPDPDEVESLVEVGAGDLLRLFDHQPHPAPSVEACEWQPGSPPVQVTIDRSDLVAPVDGYWIVLLVMAERFVASEGPLAI